MAIVTTTQVKTYLGISGSSQDTQIQALIDALTAELQRMTGRTFETATFTEYYDGDWASSITLRSPPVTSITSVAIVDIDRTVMRTLDATSYTVDSKTGVLSMRTAVGIGAPNVDSEWGWGISTIDSGNPQSYVVGDRPQFSNNVFRGVKVVYVGGFAAIPADLTMLFYDVIGSRLASIGADYSMESEHLGHYSYKREASGGDWMSAFRERVRAWMVYS